MDKCLGKTIPTEDGLNTSTKEEFNITLPFLGNQSNIVKKKLQKLFSDYYPNAKIKIVFKTGIKIGSFFKFKDTIPSHIRSLLVYKFTCSSCNATYIGKSKRHHIIRMCEHLGISWRTGKPLKYNPNQSTAIRDHIKDSGHQNKFDNFETLSFGKNNFECLLKEKILIQKFAPPLINKQMKNFNLSLF